MKSRECAWGHCTDPEYVVYVLRSTSGRVWTVGRCEKHQDDQPPTLPGMEIIGSGGDPDVVRSMDWGPTSAG